jgi:excisionase family DNA binding protein
MDKSGSSDTTHHSTTHHSTTRDDTRTLLTVEQAADHLQLSTSSIRSYIRQGKLKAYRIAGRRKVLIPYQELLSLLQPTIPTIPSPEIGRI